MRLVLGLYWDPSWKEWEASFFFSVQLLRFFSCLFCTSCTHLFLDLLNKYSLLPPHPGYGSVIQMYPGGGPVRAGVENFGFPAHFHDTLHEFPICHVNALLAGTLDTSAKDPTAGKARLFVLFFKQSFQDSYTPLVSDVEVQLLSSV